MDPLSTPSDHALDALIDHAGSFCALAADLRAHGAPTVQRFHHVSRIDVDGRRHTGPKALTDSPTNLPVGMWTMDSHASAHQWIAAQAAHDAWATRHAAHIQGMRDAVDALLDALLPRALPAHAAPHHTLGVSITVGMLPYLAVFWTPQANARVGMGGPEHSFALPGHRAYARHLLAHATRLAMQPPADRRWRVEGGLHSVLGTQGVQNMSANVLAHDACDALLCAALQGNNTLAHTDALHRLAITEERRANAAEAAYAALGPLATPGALDHLAP